MKKKYSLHNEKKQRVSLLQIGALMLMLFLFSSQQAFAQLVGWQYRDGINVHENAGTQKLNYQVLLNINTASLVSAGKMNALGNDIRFSKDCSGSVLLNYFIETGMNTANTQVWVELDTLKASGNYLLYMWYGNIAATAASNFNNTFPLSTQLVVPAGAVVLNGTNNYSWFEIQAGASVVVSPGSPFVINARKIKIAGTLNGDGAGYAGGQTSQNGSGPGGGKAGALLTPANSSGGGGAYGGNGGQGTVAGGTIGDGGTAYGNTTTIDMGSGGGGPVGGGAGATDGNGGGAITLNARTVEITGTVSVSGNAGTTITGAGFGGGGGAGGGLLLQAHDVVFLTGWANARGGNGGDGAGGGGGGGGGRINLFSEVPFTPGNYNVLPGVAGITGNSANANGMPGSPGVVYTGTYSASEPTYSFTPHAALSSSAFPICQGSTATFTASTGASTYMFYVDTALKQNASSNTFSSNSLANNNIVSVLVPDANGCKDTSNKITVIVNPKPTVTTSAPTSICIGQSTVLTASGGTSYNWSPAGSLSSSTGSSVTASPTITTTYTVLVTDNNSCQNSDTVTITVSGCTHIAKNRTASIDIYPNPAQNVLTITAEADNASEMKIALCDMLGNTVRVIDPVRSSGVYKRDIDVYDLVDGIYFITVKSGDRSTTKKFIKN